MFSFLFPAISVFSRHSDIITSWKRRGVGEGYGPGSHCEVRGRNERLSDLAWSAVGAEERYWQNWEGAEHYANF